MAKNLLGVVVGDKEANNAMDKVKTHIGWELLREAESGLLYPR